MKLFCFIALVILFINSVYSLTVSQCPSRCTCSLNNIKCSNNGLTSIPKVPSDTHFLDLRYNNIQDIAPGIFSNLERCSSLFLSGNQLTSLMTGAFHGLRRLKVLSLSSNKLRHIDPNLFQGLHSLEQLYLHVNELEFIPAEAFTNLQRLERLDLNNNRLQTIPQESFQGLPRLKRLRLDNNPIICNCSLIWITNMISSHIGMSVVGNCVAPLQLQGLAIGALRDSDLQCEQPAITTHPHDIVINYGEDAMFSCAAIGEPTPEIVWLRDSNQLPLEASRYEIMDNGTLMVHQADETDVGVFECMAKNPSGEVRSQPARMMIFSTMPRKDEVPVFVSKPTSQQVKAGHPSIKLDCVVKANPKPHVAWYFDNERLLLNERTSLQNGSLVIENIQSSDTGNYTCKAENFYGKIEASATLEVMVAPAFIKVPVDKTVTLSDKVELECIAQGIPEPTIHWYKNSIILQTSSNVNISENNNKLTIIQASYEDAGTYNCRAENNEGVTEVSAIIAVEDVQIIKPRIILKPEDTDALKETTVQFPCEVESEPAAALEWKKDGSGIIPTQRITITEVGNLIIRNVTLADAGRYECRVYNEYGRDSASFFLTITDPLLPKDEYINIALTQATRDIDQAIERTMNQLFSNMTERINVHDLFRVINFPNEPARQVARPAEIYERTLDKVKEYIESRLQNVSAAPFNYHTALTEHQLKAIARLSGCTVHREEIDCSDICYHKNFRSVDGTCNNLANPMWGSSLTGFRRVLPPIYENGFSQPVGWNKGKKYNGFTLPSARLVSTSIISTKEISQDIEITHMVMQWGQWLDHDLDHSLPSVSSETYDGVDCKKTCDYAAPCFPMDVPDNDPRIKNRRCIDFIRTSSVCGSGMSSVFFGDLQQREQINQLTSFLDASQVYGFEQLVADDLRDLSNDNGLLRVGALSPHNKPMLPTTGINGMDCRRNLDESTRNCFVAGDIRANEQIGLAAMHTIWMREHNRIALQLKSINPFWDGNKVFQEARKVVGAQMQFITYEHWLPIILGPEGMRLLGNYERYDPYTNPSISNVFATAALRFGHSMINPLLHRYDENFDTIPQGHLLLRYAFFSPWRLVDEGGVDPLLRGMFVTPAKLKTPTQNLNSELTEQLFYNAHAVALDLAAMNIQRGRDHAIPPYTEWRKFCNMSDVTDFEDLANEISDKNVRDKLRELYGSVHNIDVWVGGILEDQVMGGKIGPLFRCLLIEQFVRLRNGDRFWYENPSGFKPEQLQQIKQTSLSRILCDNGDNIDTIGENVFFLPDLPDGLISCEDIPGIDFRYWADCETCGEEISGRTKRRARRYIQEVSDYNSLARIVDVKSSHNELTSTINMLKHRVEILEDNCKTLNKH